MRANVIQLRAGMEPRGTIDPIAIEQRHRGHIQFDCALDKLLWLRCSFEEAESAGGV